MPILVPNGFSSGEECTTGSYEETIITPGTYHFISDGHTVVRVGTIKVVELPTQIVKISSDNKFLPSFVEVCEGESVTWRWETTIRGHLYKLQYCPKHGGVISSKVNFTEDVNNSDSHTECFQEPGMYYFSGDSKDMLCVVKVLQRPREFSVVFQERRVEPSFLTVHVGDRLWVKNTLDKQSESIMMVKAEDGAVLVSSRSTSSMKERRPNLLSYRFPLPGIYRVSCTLTLTRLCSIVIVKPKPLDYVININRQGFLTGLGSIKQSDRIWWVWSNDDTHKHGFLIREEEGLPLVDSNTNADTSCQCSEEQHQLSVIGNTGVLSLVADTPGLFTYRVKELGDWRLPGLFLCSIIVQSVPKEHMVQVTDHMFQPQIINIHPGDTVIWIWRDNMKSHNIQQVSHERLEMDDGFHSSMVSRSPDGFSHVFTDLGVFYYTSSNLCSVYGAVVVTAGNQVHKVEVTLHGVEPDPLGVRVGDMVCWRWNMGQIYSINTIQLPDKIDEIVKNQQVPAPRRCFAKIFSKPGLQHAVATAYLPDEDDESALVAGDSFINSIYVDHAPFSCRMRVSNDGFQPRSVVLAKHDSILWYWDEPNEKHNIVLVENPKGRSRPMTVHGPSFFESGPVTRCNSFFHTFDLPGSYWVTSHGTDGQTCRIEVLNEVKRLLSPVIIGGNDGGNVELGYRVLLSCDDHGVQILYTIDGSQPADYNPVTKVYNDQEGICLSQPGLYIIRALSTKDGWINSRTFTSRRYWVFCEEEQDEVLDNQEQTELRQEISNWQWFSCTPFISFFFVYDNVIQIDIGLPNISDMSLIAGFQLYIKGVPYGGLLSSSCPGVLVSGLAGQRIYHMVIVVFPNTEQFRPQLSNQIVVSCPALSSLGGPLVSLETCGRVDAVVIVWAANHSSLYTVLINGQPMGGQFFPDPETSYCRVLFEMENGDEEQTFMICVEMKDREEEQPFYSNEIQISLPLPDYLVVMKHRQPTMHDQEQELQQSTQFNSMQDFQLETNHNAANILRRTTHIDLVNDVQEADTTPTEFQEASNKVNRKTDDSHKTSATKIKEDTENHVQQSQNGTSIPQDDQGGQSAAKEIHDNRDLILNEDTEHQRHIEDCEMLQSFPIDDSDLRGTSAYKDIYQNRIEDTPEGPKHTPGFTIEPMELILITELPLDDKQPVSNGNDMAPETNNSYQGSLDTIHENKQLDIEFTPEENVLGEEDILKQEGRDNGVLKEEDELISEKDQEEMMLDETKLEKNDILNEEDEDGGKEDHNGGLKGEVISEAKEEESNERTVEENQNEGVFMAEDKDVMKEEHGKEICGEKVLEEKEEQDDVYKEENQQECKSEITLKEEQKEENQRNQETEHFEILKENGHEEQSVEDDCVDGEISEKKLVNDNIEDGTKKTDEENDNVAKLADAHIGREIMKNNEKEDIEGDVNKDKTNANGQVERKETFECEVLTGPKLFSQESLHIKGSSTFSKFLNQLQDVLASSETSTVLETYIEAAFAEEYHCHPVIKEIGCYSACTVELKHEKQDKEIEKEGNERMSESELENETIETDEKCDETEVENENNETDGRFDDKGLEKNQLDTNKSDERVDEHNEKQINEHEENTIEHKENTIEHEENTSEHEENTIEHEENTSEHEENTSEHEETTIEHEENTSEHEENTSEHEENKSEHEENTNEHEKNKSEHEENTIEHEENKSEHEENTIEHEENTIEHEENTSEHEENASEHEENTSEVEEKVQNEGTDDTTYLQDQHENEHQQLRNEREETNINHGKSEKKKNEYDKEQDVRNEEIDEKLNEEEEGNDFKHSENQIMNEVETSEIKQNNEVETQINDKDTINKLNDNEKMANELTCQEIGQSEEQHNKVDENEENKLYRGEVTGSEHQLHEDATKTIGIDQNKNDLPEKTKTDTTNNLHNKDMNHMLDEPGKETQRDSQNSNSKVLFNCQLSNDLKLAVKGATSNKVVLEWEDTRKAKSHEYTVMVFGDKFNSDVDSHERWQQNNSPTPDLWPSDQVFLEQHCWTTSQNLIEITGLKPRQRYRLAVLAKPHGYHDTYVCSELIPLTMPGRPKAPVLHVASLEDRKFTICWRAPPPFGEARIIGYKLLLNGVQHGDLLPPDTTQYTLDNLQYGTFQHVSLIAVTGHMVGDSTSSNVISIACPHPPPPPEIIVHPSTSQNSICLSWQPVSFTADVNQLSMLSSYHVFIDDVFHGCCPVNEGPDIFQDSFTYTIPDCTAGRTYSIYVRGHVDSRTIESTTPAHVCCCYGDKSNIVQVRCAEGPSAPGLVVNYMDETRVELLWQKPTEGTHNGIEGYVLRVDGRIHGSMLDPDDTTTTLTNLSLGNNIVVSLTALYTQDQHHVNMNHPTEGNDSGVESSSSMGIDRRIASANPGPSSSLTLHLWGFVQKVCNVRTVDVSCCAVHVRWDVLEHNMCDEKKTGQHSLYTKPQKFKVTLFKSDELEETQVMSFDTNSLDVKLTDLSPSTAYAVIVEASAQHPNQSSEASNWNVSTSEKFCFKTKAPPLSPRNIKVIYSTLSSICLSWDKIDTDNDLRFLHLSVYKIDSLDADSKMILSFVINSHMTSYTIHSLDSKTQYLFEIRTSYNQDGNDKHSCSTNSSITAWTSGVRRPHDLHVTKTTPFSLTVAWQPAVPFGNLTILHYRVHCIEKKSRAPHGSGFNSGITVQVPQGSLLGPQCEIKGLEPGVSYSITVEAVVKDNQEKEMDEQTNDADETSSSVGSSESDWLSLVAQDCQSKSITVSTTASPGKPELLVTGISATQIHLYWNKPAALHIDADDLSRANGQDLCGHIRQVSGYTLEVNGRVVTRLSANQHRYTVKRCKPGMKYTCYLVVMTTAGESGGKERRNENKKKKTLSSKTTEFTDSEDEQSNNFQESRSDPLEVTIPRQDPPLVLKLYYNPTSTNVSTSSSAGSDGPDEGCVVLEWRSSNPCKGVVSHRVRWRGTSGSEEEKDENLMASASRYEINHVKPRSVYSVWLSVTRTDSSTITYGPLHCQVPGRPESPWIWCRSISSYRVLVEWNEPRTYGVDTIRAYQINLNGRQLGKQLSLQTRKAAVHCQPNSVYRITLVALSADPNLGDAEQSNLLTVCTPGVAKMDLDLKQDIRLKPLWAENNSLTVEWSDDNDLLSVDHYVVKWSSVRQPQVREDTVPVEETSYCIEDCISGTRHFIAVAAVNDQGKLVSKSSQLIMQTSAPLTAPELRPYTALPYSIVVGWDKPQSIGDASVNSYQIRVNGEIQAIQDTNELSFEFTDCSPCDEYVFQIQALSTKHDCHSDWSAPLSIVCPGAWQPAISRAPSSHVNCIHVTWDTPRLFGGATVENYKVRYLATSEDESISLETLLDDEETITHGPLQSTTHDDTLTNALPSLHYWVVLEVTLLPHGCITVFSQPIRTRVAIPPDPPWVSVLVVGLKERKTLERFLNRLAQLKDRICRKVTLLQNTVVVKGSRQKEVQITKNLATLRNLDIELGNCVRDLKTHTGTLTAQLSWSRPRDDGDAVITGYQVFINQKKHGQPLNENVLHTDVKLPASSCDHVVTVKSLSSHPIGHSAPSSQVTLQTRDFLPFVQFCYFGVHSESLGCCYGDNLSYEIKSKQISTHRGTLGKPLPSPVCYVMDVVGSCSRPFIQGSNHPQIILFWTPWCQSSMKNMEMFMLFAHHHNDMDFMTCCVQSNQPVSGHYQSLHAHLQLHDWLTSDVKHMCACHPVGQRSLIRRNEGGGSKASVSHTYGLVGVPTIVLCNNDGFIVWQGRVFAQDFNEYQQFLLHAVNESLNGNCTIPACDQCLLDNELDTTGLTSHLIKDPMDDYYNYKSANYDPSLVVTGRLSRCRETQSTNDRLIDLQHSTDFYQSDSSLTQSVHPTTLENTEFLSRRLHDTRPRTSPSRDKTPSRSRPRSPKLSLRLSNDGRAKTANQTRSSVFQNRFSSSMTSSLPSLGLTNDKSLSIGPGLTNERSVSTGVGLTNKRSDSKRQRPLTTKSKKVKISVEEFSPC